MRARHQYSQLNNQRGVSAIIIAICLIMLVGFVGLAIDVSHLVVARNELQNAADAGALAGAGNLYLNDGTAINTNANQFGYDAAVANLSEQAPVEVNWTSGNTGDVQRGHWSFGLGALPRGFYPNASTATVDLWGVTTEELDANPNFINAVRVRARRQSPPITSFFARIFGFQSFQGSAEAVAYIGFAGTLKTGAADAPIAICEQALIESDGSYNCMRGRFINDAAGGQDEETGMWTSFDQHRNEEGEAVGWTEGAEPCDGFPGGGTNASEVKPLVDCSSPSGVNQTMLHFGKGMEVNNGQIDAAFNDFFNECWQPHIHDYLGLRLPVINCENDPTTCAELVGYVEVLVIWVTQQPNYKDLPSEKYPIDVGDGQYGSWKASVNAADCSGDPECIWDNFARHYGLVDSFDTPVDYNAKTIYFLKSCIDHKPEGVTGGENFGILAEIPVLVD